MCNFTIVNHKCGHWVAHDANVVSPLSHLLDYEALPFHRCADGMRSITLGGVTVFCPETRYVDIHSIFVCIACRREKLLRKKAKTETQRYMDMVLRQARTRLAEEREAEDNKTLVGTGNVTPVAERETEVKIPILAEKPENKAPSVERKTKNNVPLARMKSEVKASLIETKTKNNVPMVVCGTVRTWKSREALWKPPILLSTNMEGNDADEDKKDSGLTLNLRSGPPSFPDAVREFDSPTQRWFGIEKLRFEKLMEPRMVNVADLEFNVQRNTYTLSYHNRLRKRLGEF